MHSDDGLGQAMANANGWDALQNSRKAAEEIKALRQEIAALMNRVAYLERLANVDPNVARAYTA